MMGFDMQGNRGTCEEGLAQGTVAGGRPALLAPGRLAQAGLPQKRQGWLCGVHQELDGTRASWPVGPEHPRASHLVPPCRHLLYD